MAKNNWFAWVVAGLSATGPLPAENFADAVVDYDPGAGYAVNYTNVNAVLGEPSRANPFNDPTEPFNPPYGTGQILSVGAGGSLTVRFSTPILNHPNNSFGLDFIIFGNTGFIITNDFDPVTFEWIGTPATDGSLFAQNTGSTRVLVSRDGETFFELDPARAPVVDHLFPTDGWADFSRPVDPILTQEDFAGLTLEQIRALYNGSAGGAAFDISWARDSDGQPVFLPEIKLVRVEVLSGKSEIDGVVAASRRARGPNVTGR
ncbi:MAG: hypothetical protein L0Y58_17075 [Verrucomicrobia subdivision 3 bacterium]|nr:hypothetical protein [Limisphaerales bacterium]